MGLGDEPEGSSIRPELSARDRLGELDIMQWVPGIEADPA
jgi:hypothetical protein